MLFINLRGVLALLIAAGSLAAIVPGPAAGQGNDRDVLDGMRACATIDDAGRRTACYDRYLRPPAAGSAAAPEAIPAPAPAMPRPAIASVGSPRGRVAAEVRGLPEERYRGAVSAAVERAPGIYLLTMQDGAQWQFASTVRGSYDPPSSGSTVEIQPGALGSFLLSYNDQSAVRVIRIR